MADVVVCLSVRAGRPTTLSGMALLDCVYVHSIDLVAHLVQGTSLLHLSRAREHEEHALDCFAAGVAGEDL